MNQRITSFLSLRQAGMKALIYSVMILMPVICSAQNTTEMKKNKQLVQAEFDKWAQGQGSFFDLLAPDVKWTITGNSPISKTYTSRQQFLDEAITPLNKRLSKPIVPKVRAIYAEGNSVIALWDGTATATDGVPYNNTYSWYMKFSKGKIVEVVAFFDTIDLADLWKRIPNVEGN